MASQRSPHTPSSIPTRTSKTFLPTPRRPSFSTPGPSSPTVAGASSFRTLRSLLPFGPNKHSTPSGPSSPNPGGPRFASFSVRRSINKDRNASHSSSHLPVMIIDQASADNSVELPVRKSISLYEQKPSSLETAPLPTAVPILPTLNFSNAPEKTAPSPSPDVKETLELAIELKGEPTMPPPPVFTPRAPSPLLELSTIIEADTSGISKHLPSASPSPSPSPSPTNPSHDSPDTSALDLSTTHLTSQVMDAMAAPKPWPDIDEPGRSLGSDPEDLSFNFSSLDPDLAALLSPNRMVPSDTEDTIKWAINAPVDLSHSPLLSTPDGLPHQSSRPRLRPIQRPSTPPDAATLTPPRSPAVPSPRSMRRVPPSPLALSRPPSPVPASATTSPPLSLSNTSPAISSTPAAKRTHNTTASATPSLNSRRPMLGRMLQSDSWESTPSSSSARSRPSLDSASLRPSSASASPSRTSLDTARHRPSLDSNRHGNGFSANTVRERPSESTTAWNIKRRRKRSMSVDEQRVSPSGYFSPYSESRPGSSMSSSPEWLGPRTAKAFKAAGLLGPESPDGNDSLSPPLSGRTKFGSVRGSSTVGRSDSRAGSVVSPPPRRRRGSGSGSYFGSAGSQLMESPTFTMSSRDTPRSASTAPTSVSGASWGRDGDHEIRELKDKHSVETGALLSALSDSQRTTKVLREENSELRERIAQLEADLERTVALERENKTLRELMAELRDEAGQLKLQLRLAAPVVSSSRYLSQATTQAFRLTDRNESPRSADENIPEESNNLVSSSSSKDRRRLSSSSSIFPVPPSNMSLLLHDDGAHSSDYDDRSGASGSFVASPTMVLARVDPSPERAHRANKSITSVTTTSPNASMLGSPRSLLLRPEHEVHLGDMESLDLGRPGPDEEWSE